MMQYGWENCPDETRNQVERLIAGCHEILGEGLIGVYLHGSLAMGCFNPDLSDMDVLVVAAHALTKDERRNFAGLMLDLSLQPHPIEISVLDQMQIFPWRHPAPFEFHYSEGWRDRQIVMLEDSSWGEPLSLSMEDSDLAAHFVIARERGIALYGVPAKIALPQVPVDDYLDALLDDFDSAAKSIRANPVYGILNQCRVYWFLLKSAISSKDEAGEWAGSYLPEEYRGIVARALRIYRGQGSGAQGQFTDESLMAFNRYLDSQVRELLV
jgi:streptomycin 3"-adenylyltransferase